MISWRLDKFDLNNNPKIFLRLSFIFHKLILIIISIIPIALRIYAA